MFNPPVEDLENLPCSTGIYWNIFNGPLSKAKATNYEGCTAGSRAAWSKVSRLFITLSGSVHSWHRKHMMWFSNCDRFETGYWCLTLLFRYMMNLKQKQAEAYAQKLKRFFMTLDASGGSADTAEHSACTCFYLCSTSACLAVHQDIQIYTVSRWKSGEM